MRYALKVFYDGRGFSGSQRQPNVRTVEAEFLGAVERLNIDYGGFRTAGRTDRGVSAIGNVFSLSTPSKLIRPRILNSALPSDIRVIAAKKVNDDFNPRHARERVYRYFLWDEGFELEEIRGAAKEFVGNRSFHNFSSTDYRSPIRTINSIDVSRTGDMLVLSFSGESFLWQMVRRMVTALKSAGKGELSRGDLKRYLDPDFNRKVPPSDPAGLVLWDVKYGFEFTCEEYSKKRLLTGLEKRLLKIKSEKAVLLSIIDQIR